MSNDNKSAYEIAVAMQAQAARPDKSIFVSANAGSGKTRVLVERVSRILLTGTPPDKIMCLTYTKAAASEMQTRLFESLGAWSIMSENELSNELNRLEGGSDLRPQDSLNRARSLFARALETPGGLKVQTIHAFCERLLKRFPLEAGITPGTDPIDESDTSALYEQVWTEIETQALREQASGGNSQLATDISLLAAHHKDQAMDAVYSWAMNSAYKIDKWQQSGGVDGLARDLGVDAGTDAHDILEKFWSDADLPKIKEAALEMLQSTSSKNNDRGQFIIDALVELENIKSLLPPLVGEVGPLGLEGGQRKALHKPAEQSPSASVKTPAPPPQVGEEKIMEAYTSAFNSYKKAFFTARNKIAGEGEYFKTIVFSKDCPIAMNFFGAKEPFGLEAIRTFKTRNILRCVNYINYTRALYNIAVLSVSKYRALKQARRVMDFDDQIYLARGLLMNSEAREWVRFKLDGGVDHILLDEAQDTSESQWDIVSALSEEFFQIGADTRPRTIFAVGDEKQSIYGFQGAKPELFLDRIQDLATKQIRTPEVKMSMSFRSTGEILNLVDEIYYNNKGILETFNVEFFPPASDKGHHDAHRSDPGLVELWPPTPAPEKGEEEKPAKPVPVDSLNARSSREKLAAEIATQIDEWLSNKEPVQVRSKDDKGKPIIKTRPMRPADILILVQKRGQFFNGIIRNLKGAGVPVAGADRLKLTDSIAVQDMLSLAKFTCLPSDDLALAEVLKSPIFGWNDDQLFAIAYDRKATLWDAVPTGYERETLSKIIALSEKFAPYEFFARTLALVPTDGGESILQKIMGRLGLEAADVLDAFLSRALAHQRRGAPSLQRFIHAIEASETTIKREMDAAQNEVRVMTVHGAKGLEAPVVILPDTTSKVDIRNEKYFEYPQEADRQDVHTYGFVPRVSGAEAPEFLGPLEEAAKQAAERESMRLLYVALTRAESRLLICGFMDAHAKNIPETCWHRRIQNSLESLKLESLKQPPHAGVTSFETPFGDGLRYGMRPTPAQQETTQAKPISDLPPWVHSNVAPAKASPRHMSPSQLASPSDLQKFSQPARSPLAMDTMRVENEIRFARGNLIHKLLEILPDLAPHDRASAAQSYLRKQGLAQPETDALCAEVFAVLNDPQFAHVFAPGTQAEVALAGSAVTLPADMRLSGQIDRLCVTDTEVWIVDYKSNRPPPSHIDDVAPLYVRQMAAYRALVGELYQGRAIRAALLWTDGPTMMELPAEVLDKVDWQDVMSA